MIKFPPKYNKKELLLMIADQMCLAIHTELETNEAAFRKYPSKVGQMIHSLEKILDLIRSQP